MQTLQLRWIKEKKKKRKKGEERIEKGKNFREKCYDRGGEKYKEGRKEGRKGERFRYPLVGNSDNASAHLSSRWILDGPASLFPLLPGLERRGTRSIGNPSPETRRRKHRSRARPQCIFTYEGSVKAFTLPTDISRRSQTTSRAPPPSPSPPFPSRDVDRIGDDPFASRARILTPGTMLYERPHSSSRRDGYRSNLDHISSPSNLFENRINRCPGIVDWLLDIHRRWYVFPFFQRFIRKVFF